MLESCSRWQGLCTECRLGGSVTHPPPLFVKTRPSHSILWSLRAEGSRLIYGAQTELPGWDDSSTWTLPRGKPPASAWLVVACAWQLAIVLEWRHGSRRDLHPGRTRRKSHPGHCRPLPGPVTNDGNKINDACLTFETWTAHATLIYLQIQRYQLLIFFLIVQNDTNNNNNSFCFLMTGNI